MNNLNNYTESPLYTLMHLLNQEFAVLSKIDFNHPYCVSTLWNLNAMYNVLNQE